MIAVIMGVVLAAVSVSFAEILHFMGAEEDVIGPGTSLSEGCLFGPSCLGCNHKPDSGPSGSR